MNVKLELFTLAKEWKSQGIIVGICLGMANIENFLNPF